MTTKRTLPAPTPRKPIALIPACARLRACLEVQDPQSAEGTIRVRRGDLRVILDYLDGDV